MVGTVIFSVLYIKKEVGLREINQTVEQQLRGLAGRQGCASDLRGLVPFSYHALLFKPEERKRRGDKKYRKLKQTLVSFHFFPYNFKNLLHTRKVPDIL